MTEFGERVAFIIYIRDKIFSTKVSNNRKFIYIIQGIGIKLDLKLVELKIKIFLCLEI